MTSTSSIEDILNEIEANRDDYIQLLQHFIQAASPNPPGDTTKASQVILDFLSQHGISADIIAPQAHMPNIVTDFDGKQGPGPRVVFNGHIDTFPASESEKWKRDPYSGHNGGSSIHGLGAVDMKAGTAASVIAFTLLKKRAQHLRGSIALTAVSDEETGGKYGTKYLLEQTGSDRWKGDCVINGEPGGLQSVRFGEKGLLRLNFTVSTRGANGAYKNLSRGANILAARLITALQETVEALPSDLPQDLKEHFDNPDVRDVVDEIIGPGSLTILPVHVIPSQAAFTADIRLPIGLTRNKVLAQINIILKDFPEASYVVHEAASNPANYLAHDHPFAKCITDVTERVTGSRPLPLAGMGGTDCKFFRYKGVPAFVLGVSPKGMGARGEAVLIEEFVAVVKVHTLAVWKCLSVGQT
ncbi:putative acetylornithine deacetylase [Cucurbitaria berberidis CBS 394.84]|uniref:Acetylornithine deacetylase n=1 Tax=Cucurbitaria berberidis CBS 394.84 TaxID=1168544 RepID=A0A9P4GF65_9PLEO|nr:putative acetylornithine deacetylase [Cucurbitaria berberidis CBS 394.84]KAF1844440.1 putative acetylornithine deacetylase [Cucurbitaria berberidis CBS 394.84]